MINQLAATALLCTGMVLGSPAKAASAYQPHVLVGHSPYAVAPLDRVQIPVSFGYHDPGQGGRWVALPLRKLTVEGYRVAGAMQDHFNICDVVTDENGQAVISFHMPYQLCNPTGRAVATALRVTVRFAEEPPHLKPAGENRLVQLVIR